MDDEDRWVVPEAWHARLDGRAGGRLTLEQAELLIDDPEALGGGYLDWIRDSALAAYTLAAELGVEAVVPLADLAPLGSGLDAGAQSAVGEALSAIPSDAAFEALLDRSLQSTLGLRAYAGTPVLRNERCYAQPLEDATERFPKRALRILARRSLGGGPPADRARALLQSAVRRHGETARSIAPTLPDAERLAVEAILDASSTATAPRDAWPAILREPPWTQKRKNAAPKAKLALTRLEVPTRVDWRGDERARWRGPEVAPPNLAALDEDGWQRFVSETRAEPYRLGFILLYAPTPVAAAVAASWAQVPRRSEPALLRATVARLEAEALPLVERWASQVWAIEAALPLGAPSLARPLAAGLGKTTSREIARAWFLRHPEVAAIGLVPDALGADAKARKAAVEGLELLVREGLGEVVTEVAGRYGEAAAAAIAPVLDASPLDAVPSRLPKMPAFWDAASLPALVTDGGAVLPPEASEAFGSMLAFSKPGAPYAGIRVVADACTRDSVIAFSWALFEAWTQAGAPNDASWAFTQLAWLGDDSVAYRLLARMKVWPGQGAAKRAERGLDVLAEMQSDVALVLVHELAQKGRGSLRKNAAKKLTRLAAVRGLGEAELADRLVPTLDLDASGSMVLDYGPRSFRVGFDEELLPFVLDENGEPRKALPKPGKRDDPKLAPAADARFKALKKAVRTVAKTQLTRLERAMATERRWSGHDLQRYVVDHPLLVHVARRLVFGLYEGGRLTRSFRVQDDRSPADVDEEPCPFAGDASVGIAHPVDLGPDAIARWSEVLADYELMQPFAQLAREHTTAADGPRADVLADACREPVAPQRVAALEDQGWVRGPVGDGAMFDTMERVVGPGRRMILTVRPGLMMGMVHASDLQTLHEVRVLDAGVEVPIDALSPVAFSELIRDLRALAR
ncbi:MAG: DUF4132 domain-containing protein [Sandaracinaceae bacterium]|nr:DUF4132 domain-containing protein [Sandaracinaceae bacterium]